MAVKFSEAIKELKEAAKGHEIRRIKLINGEVIEGVIKAYYMDMIEIIIKGNGAGSPTYTIPFTAILYISDCEL